MLTSFGRAVAPSWRVSGILGGACARFCGRAFLGRGWLRWRSSSASRGRAEFPVLLRRIVRRSVCDFAWWSSCGVARSDLSRGTIALQQRASGALSFRAVAPHWFGATRQVECACVRACVRACGARAGFVEERRLSRLAAEGGLVRRERLGGLRACSRVIRAHWVRRGEDEDGGARITRSPALVGFDGWVIFFLGDLFS